MLTDDEIRTAHGRFLDGHEPPHWVIERARRAAVLSPCHKSKRGAAIYDPEHEQSRFNAIGRDSDASDPDTDPMSPAADSICYAQAHNGPPAPYKCDGSFECRMDCPKICIHAEQRAILAVIGLTELTHLELVHVKVVDGRVVPGGGPSCWQCSRLVVEVGLKGVWLYEECVSSGVGQSTTFGAWRFYTAEEFHEATAAHERNMAVPGTYGRRPLHVVR